MSLCPVTRTQCVCQPDEGFHCPYYPSAIEQARREAFEEAAQIADGFVKTSLITMAEQIAAAIRARGETK